MIIYEETNNLVSGAFLKCFSILHLQKSPFLPFMTSQSDVNNTLTLRHLFCFCRDLVCFKVQKDLSL